MLSTAIMSVIGFVFWIINARLFSEEQIGITTSLVATVGLIGGLSQLGFNNSLIRYLPKEENKADDINTILTVVLLTSFIAGIILILFLPYFSSTLNQFSKNNSWFLYFTIFFICIAAINGLTDSIFLAFKSAKYTLIINTVMSVIKVSLPLVLFTYGTIGLMGSFILSILVALILSLWVIHVKFHIKIKLQIKRDVLRKLAHFSFGNYIANLIGGLPSTLLPIFILNTLGPKMAAYFYMPMMIANFLYIIPGSTARSMFAEGSYNEDNIRQYIKKSLFLILVIMIPVIMVIFLFGKYVLLTFGKNYSSEGTNLLYLLTISGIFVSINSIIWIILVIKKKMKLMIIISSVSTVAIFLYIYLLREYQLTGVGVGWLLGQVTITLIELVVLYKLITGKKYVN